MDTDTSVSMNSFDKSGNSVIVFGAAKWMRKDHHRLRVHDGLLDQIEIYDQALTESEVAARYNAFAATVPEPTSVILWCQLVAFGIAVSYRRKRRTRFV